MVEVMANTAITEAKIQVPFSNTSVVCLTPMKLLDKPPTFAFKPPPLGFWINTIKPKPIQAAIINMINKVIIISFVLIVLYETQNKRIFQEK